MGSSAFYPVIALATVLASVGVVAQSVPGGTYFTGGGAPGAAAYSLVDNYEPSGFFDKFNFYSSYDPTYGHVQYVNESVAVQNGYATVKNNSAFISVDTTNQWPRGGPGRPSVRIISDNTYTHGLFVLDLAHMPWGCGTWPAYWLLGPMWPYTGEIDIIEGVNTLENNTISMHTDAGCTISGSGQTGILETSDCNEADNGNSGCGSTLVDATNYHPYGDNLNAAGGGYYVTEWTSDYVQHWYFPRAYVPASIIAGTPNVSTFGEPAVNAQGSCNIDAHFSNMSIIVNTDFCGAWAGEVYGYPPYASQCPQNASAGSSLNSCVDFVGNNPSAFVNAYWQINSIKVYQMPANVATTSTYSTSLSSVTPLASSNTRSVTVGMGVSTSDGSTAYTGPLSSATSSAASSSATAICVNNTRSTDSNGIAYQIYTDSDSNGGGSFAQTYTFYSGDFTQCETGCDSYASQGCTGWVWVPLNDSGEGGNCYYKSGALTPAISSSNAGKCFGVMVASGASAATSATMLSSSSDTTHSSKLSSTSSPTFLRTTTSSRVSTTITRHTGTTVATISDVSSVSTSTEASKRSSTTTSTGSAHSTSTSSSTFVAVATTCPDAAKQTYTDTNEVSYTMGCYRAFAGDDIGTPLNESTIDGCMECCDTLSYCTGLMYNPSAKLCMLKTALTGTQTNNQSIIYARRVPAVSSSSSSTLHSSSSTLGVKASSTASPTHGTSTSSSTHGTSTSTSAHGTSTASSTLGTSTASSTLDTSTSSSTFNTSASSSHLYTSTSSSALHTSTSSSTLGVEISSSATLLLVSATVTTTPMPLGTTTLSLPAESTVTVTSAPEMSSSVISSSIVGDRSGTSQTSSSITTETGSASLCYDCALTPTVVFGTPGSSTTMMANMSSSHPGYVGVFPSTCSADGTGTTTIFTTSIVTTCGPNPTCQATGYPRGGGAYPSGPILVTATGQDGSVNVYTQFPAGPASSSIGNSGARPTSNSGGGSHPNSGPGSGATTITFSATTVIATASTALPTCPYSNGAVFTGSMGMQYLINCNSLISNRSLDTQTQSNLASCISSCDSYNVRTFYTASQCLGVSYLLDVKTDNCLLKAGDKGAYQPNAASAFLLTQYAGPGGDGTNPIGPTVVKTMTTPALTSYIVSGGSTVIATVTAGGSGSGGRTTIINGVTTVVAGSSNPGGQTTVINGVPTVIGGSDGSGGKTTVINGMTTVVGGSNGLGGDGNGNGVTTVVGGSTYLSSYAVPVTEVSTYISRGITYVSTYGISTAYGTATLIEGGSTVISYVAGTAYTATVTTTQYSTIVSTAISTYISNGITYTSTYGVTTERETEFVVSNRVSTVAGPTVTASGGQVTVTAGGGGGGATTVYVYPSSSSTSFTCRTYATNYLNGMHGRREAMSRRKRTLFDVDLPKLPRPGTVPMP